MPDDESPFDEPVELPIDGILDLHSFSPRDVGALVSEYLDACRERGILEVRIIHGKGTGALRRTVRALLDKRTDILRVWTPTESDGGWGATCCALRPATGP